MNMFNLKSLKNKPYYLNFEMKILVICHYNSYVINKVYVVRLVLFERILHVF